jgi:type VI secretion system protein ImpC
MSEPWSALRPVQEILGEALRLGLRPGWEASGSLTKKLQQWLAQIDGRLSEQQNEVLHDPSFQRLEAAWRGLHYLVTQTQTGPDLHIRVLNVTRQELADDLRAGYEQSQLFHKVYAQPYETTCGTPFGLLVGDYAFGPDHEDIDLLGKIAHVAAEAFAPFIAAASPRMFGLQSWTELSTHRDLGYIHQQIEYVRWRSFRDLDDARFVALVMPRVLSRLPYGSSGRPVEAFDYQEFPLDEQGRPRPAMHEHCAWMSAAYVLAARITDAFACSGWCTAIRGIEGGGKVEGLPTFSMQSEDGNPTTKGPTEVAMEDRRERELATCGLLPLLAIRNTACAVFLSLLTTHRPRRYVQAEPTVNAAISARLPYVLATSRISHYLMVMARDPIGSFMEVQDCEDWLNRWISNYVQANPSASREMKARYPLAAANIKVQEVSCKPGFYTVTAWLQPWLPLEELRAALPSAIRVPGLHTCFRAPAVAPVWLQYNGGVVVRMARAIQGGKVFADLPILADALEEAGCTDAAILGHCREEFRDHTHGCWVLDLLLAQQGSAEGACS